MKVDVKDKYFWFVYVELLCGFAASICWLQYAGHSFVSTVDNNALDNSVARGKGYNKGGNSNRDHATYNVLHGILISGGLFPVVFRSMVYTYQKEMGKATLMTLMIIALCVYIVGGVFWLIDTELYARGIFAIAAGVILIVDLVMKMLGK